MNRKERVKRAFHFNRPDRVPILGLTAYSDFFPIEPAPPKSWQPTDYPPHVNGGVTAISAKSYRNHVYDWDKDIHDKLGYTESWWEESYTSIDEYGVLWRSSGILSEDKTMGHPYKGSFENDEIWDNIENYQFPDGNNPERFQRIKTGWWKSLAEDRYLLGILGSSAFFNKASQMRGFNTFIIDLARNRYPSRINFLLNSILEFNSNVARNLKENCPELDSIMMADDMGTQNSPFLSINIFRKYIKEKYKKLVNLTHDLGMDFILHSCGNVLPLIPEFIDIGIDALQFDSPHMSGVEGFKHFAYERKMAFWLSSNIKSTFVHGTSQEVEEEIKYYIKEVGNNEGGLGVCEYVDFNAINAPKRYVRAQRKAVLKWGNYNENGVIDWLT